MGLDPESGNLVRATNAALAHRVRTPVRTSKIPREREPVPSVGRLAARDRNICH